MFLRERLGQPEEKRNPSLCPKASSAPRSGLTREDSFFEFVHLEGTPFKTHKCATSTTKGPEGRSKREHITIG